MITQRSQYKFVTPPSDIVIDGGIMPARDVADDGSWSVLRGEDACFLAEASHRIRLYHNYGHAAPPDPPEVTRGIYGSPFMSARAAVSSKPTLVTAFGSVLYAFPGEPSLKGGYVMDVGSGMLNVVQGVLYNSGAMFTPTQPGGFSNALDADAVRGVYYDLRQSGFHVADDEAGMGFYGNRSVTHSSYQWDSDANDYEFQGSDTTAYNGGGVFTMTKYHSSWGAHEYVYDWALTTIPPGSGSYGATGLAPLYNGDVECYAVIPVTVTYGPNGSATTYYDAIVRNGIVGSDGVVKITALSANNVRDAVSGARSIPMSFGGTPDLYQLFVSISNPYVVFYDPGIDTSDIDWQWGPPSAA